MKSPRADIDFTDKKKLQKRISVQHYTKIKFLNLLQTEQFAKLVSL